MTREELRISLFGRDPCPEWGLILGSGFDGWLQRLEMGKKVSFSEVDGVARTSAWGHEGSFGSALVEGRPVALAVGRLHLYEGLDCTQVVEPLEVLRSMGVTSVLLTTAVGSVRDGFEPGDAVVIKDQINLTGEDPHAGKGSFHDASALYDPDYIQKLTARGFKPGILAGVRGPSFETPAEVGALKALGADVVCMSTVLEALSLADSAVRCAGLAVVANRAGSRNVTHDTVVHHVRQTAQALWHDVSQTLILGNG